MLKEDIDAPGEKIAALVRQIFACNRRTQLEGVGPISTVLLYATSGTGETFLNVRLFSAYLGVTPKQYSSGGLTVLVGISRYIANKRLRAVLIQGVREYVLRLNDPHEPKERWLWAVIQQARYGHAAAAPANKNARTAWALLTQCAV